ncbi:MAG: glycosyltransferase family 2 protein [Candidatus Bathyarchaeota archaeon]|nr:MAG: glycosyltransferase family 2 protein [Candidatus Bathyarchaeota archaeon]
MSKISVIIPARDEEKTIGNVVKRVPTVFSSSVSVIVIVDEGTNDHTASVAKKAGAKVINQGATRGLAEAFRTGLKEALKENADIIVTIDADAQYFPEDIPRLIAPILAGKADVVLGSRFAGRIEGMPLGKKIGNAFFTWITRKITGVPITDSQTGFRAMTKEVAENLEITSDYTYTQEMIIDAAYKGFRIEEEPISFAKRRYGKSRLIPNLHTYAVRAIKTIVECYIKNLSKFKRHQAKRSSMR